MLELKIDKRLRTEKAPCKHFGSCGGCSLQDVPYKKQLELKKEAICKLFGKDIEIKASPKKYHYRNKIELVCAFSRIGMRKRGNFKEVVELEECWLHSKVLGKILKKAKQLIKKYEIEDYDYINHKGYLRYIVVRSAKFTKELMINFVTSNEDEKIEKVAEEFERDVNSIVWSVNSSLSDTAYGKLKKYWKRAYITEKFDDIKLSFGPNTFFQNNSYVAREIYRKIKEFVSGNVLDLYAGCASISCYIASDCNNVEAVELNDESYFYGRFNIDANGLRNVTLIKADVRKYLIDRNRLNFDWIILDPPRAGLQRALKHIMRLEPKKIIYISCNPKVLAFELGVLRKKYEIREIEAYDMFPHTPHAEVLCVLELKR